MLWIFFFHYYYLFWACNSSGYSFILREKNWFFFFYCMRTRQWHSIYTLLFHIRCVSSIYLWSGRLVSCSQFFFHAQSIIFFYINFCICILLCVRAQNTLRTNGFLQCIFLSSLLLYVTLLYFIDIYLACGDFEHADHHK